MRFSLFIALATSALSCGDPAQSPIPQAPGAKQDHVADHHEPSTAPQLAGDVEAVVLDIDLASRKGTAEIAAVSGGDDDDALSLQVGGLRIDSVADSSGQLISYDLRDGLLTIPSLASATGSIVVDYGFSEQQGFEGLLSSGATFTWPYYCGNLFPCDPSPADGHRFALKLAAVPDGQIAIYPRSIDSDAPAYMAAWAVGDYSYTSLGTTTAGTELGVWWLDDQQQDAEQGTAELRAAFDWFEQTLGSYAFGPRAGSVIVRWGPGAYGGMEHHPFWHVGAASVAEATTHVHEAAHGWYGNGVRFRCWEDFVLSEGVVTYLTARALEATSGEARGAQVWQTYNERLRSAVDQGDGVAWPDSCGEVDILKDGLFSSIPYMKGAFFFRAVADAVGVEALDGVLGRFYRAHVGNAVGMQDLLDAIAADTGFDPSGLAEAWLRGLGIPD